MNFKLKILKYSYFLKKWLSCHAEFISASKIEILKQVQNDIILRRYKYSFITFWCIAYLIFCPFYSYAEDLAPIFPFEEGGQLTPENIKIQKYKMERIRIKEQNDGWYIIQGINQELSDETLLKLVNEHGKLEELNKRKMIATGISSVGMLVGVGGAFFLSNVVPIENGTWIGIGLTVGGIGLTLAGELLNPVVFDDMSQHFLTMEEASVMADIYNKNLCEKLGLPDIPE